MKKIIVTLLFVTLVLVSCSAGNTDSAETTVPTETAAQTAATTEAVTEATELLTVAPFAVEFDGGKTVTLGAPAEDVIPALGDYTDMIEAPSCIHEGNDKVYFYDGFSVTTSPDGDGGEYVAQVEITSDTCTLANGIAIGSAKDDIIKAYGEDFTEQFGMMSFVLDGAGMTVNVQDDVVMGIVFTAE